MAEGLPTVEVHRRPRLSAAVKHGLCCIPSAAVDSQDRQAAVVVFAVPEARLYSMFQLVPGRHCFLWTERTSPSAQRSEGNADLNFALRIGGTIHRLCVPVRKKIHFIYRRRAGPNAAPAGQDVHLQQIRLHSADLVRVRRIFHNVMPDLERLLQDTEAHLGFLDSTDSELIANRAKVSHLVITPAPEGLHIWRCAAAELPPMRAASVALDLEQCHITLRVDPRASLPINTFRQIVSALMSSFAGLGEPSLQTDDSAVGNWSMDDMANDAKSWARIRMTPESLQIKLQDMLESRRRGSDDWQRRATDEQLLRHVVEVVVKYDSVTADLLNVIALSLHALLDEEHGEGCSRAVAKQLCTSAMAKFATLETPPLLLCHILAHALAHADTVKVAGQVGLDSELVGSLVLKELGDEPAVPQLCLGTLTRPGGTTEPSSRGAVDGNVMNDVSNSSFLTGALGHSAGAEGADRCDGKTVASGLNRASTLPNGRSRSGGDASDVTGGSEHAREVGEGGGGMRHGSGGVQVLVKEAGDASLKKESLHARSGRWAEGRQGSVVRSGSARLEEPPYFQHSRLGMDDSAQRESDLFAQRRGSYLDQGTVQLPLPPQLQLLDIDWPELLDPLPAPELPYLQQGGAKAIDRSSSAAAELRQAGARVALLLLLMLRLPPPAWPSQKEPCSPPLLPQKLSEHLTAAACLQYGRNALPLEAEDDADLCASCLLSLHAVRKLLMAVVSHWSLPQPALRDHRAPCAHAERQLPPESGPVAPAAADRKGQATSRPVTEAAYDAGNGGSFCTMAPGFGATGHLDVMLGNSIRLVEEACVPIHDRGLRSAGHEVPHRLMILAAMVEQWGDWLLVHHAPDVPEQALCLLAHPLVALQRQLAAVGPIGSWPLAAWKLARAILHLLQQLAAVAQRCRHLPLVVWVLQFAFTGADSDGNQPGEQTAAEQDPPASAPIAVAEAVLAAGRASALTGSQLAQLRLDALQLCSALLSLAPLLDGPPHDPQLPDDSSCQQQRAGQADSPLQRPLAIQVYAGLEFAISPQGASLRIADHACAAARHPASCADDGGLALEAGLAALHLLHLAAENPQHYTAADAELLVPALWRGFKQLYQSPAADSADPGSGSGIAGGAHGSARSRLCVAHLEVLVAFAMRPCRKIRGWFCEQGLVEFFASEVSLECEVASQTLRPCTNGTALPPSGAGEGAEPSSGGSQPVQEQPTPLESGAASAIPEVAAGSPTSPPPPIPSESPLREGQGPPGAASTRTRLQLHLDHAQPGPKPIPPLNLQTVHDRLERQRLALNRRSARRSARVPRTGSYTSLNESSCPARRGAPAPVAMSVQLPKTGTAVLRTGLLQVGAPPAPPALVMGSAPSSPAVPSGMRPPSRALSHQPHNSRRSGTATPFSSPPGEANLHQASGRSLEPNSGIAPCSSPGTMTAVEAADAVHIPQLRHSSFSAVHSHIHWPSLPAASDCQLSDAARSSNQPEAGSAVGESWEVEAGLGIGAEAAVIRAQQDVREACWLMAVVRVPPGMPPPQLHSSGDADEDVELLEALEGQGYFVDWERLGEQSRQPRAAASSGSPLCLTPRQLTRSEDACGWSASSRSSGHAPCTVHEPGSCCGEDCGQQAPPLCSLSSHRIDQLEAVLLSSPDPAGSVSSSSDAEGFADAAAAASALPVGHGAVPELGIPALPRLALATAAASRSTGPEAVAAGFSPEPSGLLAADVEVSTLTLDTPQRVAGGHAATSEGDSRLQGAIRAPAGLPLPAAARFTGDVDADTDMLLDLEDQGYVVDWERLMALYATAPGPGSPRSTSRSAGAGAEAAAEGGAAEAPQDLAALLQLVPDDDSGARWLESEVAADDTELDDDDNDDELDADEPVGVGGGLTGQTMRWMDTVDRRAVEEARNNGGLLTALESAVQKEGTAAMKMQQALFKQSLTLQGMKAVPWLQLQSSPHTHVQYEAERAGRLLYRDRALHLAALELLLALLIDRETGSLDRRYLDSFPTARGLPNLLFLLHHHLNHPDNADLLPALVLRGHAQGRPAVRLLKLLVKALFNREPYRNARRVARGAYAQVYFCDVVPVGGPASVALKVVDLPNSAHDHMIVFDLFSEISIMERGHADRAVCSLYDYGVTDDALILVLHQYRCSLSTWRRQLRLGPLPARVLERLLLAVFELVLEALDRMNAPDGYLVHFDLKCDNILLKPHPGTSAGDFWSPPSEVPTFDVVLADFGESQLFFPGQDPAAAGCGAHSAAASRCPGACCAEDHPAAGVEAGAPAAVPVSPKTFRNRGTDCVKSPEMLRVGNTAGLRTAARGTGGVGRRSDVWSLGCLLFEMFTGEYLFYDPDWARFFIRVTQDGQPLYSPERLAVLETLPLLRHLLDFMLVRDPSRRPGLQDVLQVLRRVRAAGSLEPPWLRVADGSSSASRMQARATDGCELSARDFCGSSASACVSEPILLASFARVPSAGSFSRGRGPSDGSASSDGRGSEPCATAGAAAPAASTVGAGVLDSRELQSHPVSVHFGAGPASAAWLPVYQQLAVPLAHGLLLLPLGLCMLPQALQQHSVTHVLLLEPMHVGGAPPPSSKPAAACEHGQHERMSADARAVASACARAGALLTYVALPAAVAASLQGSSFDIDAAEAWLESHACSIRRLSASAPGRTAPPSAVQQPRKLAICAAEPGLACMLAVALLRQLQQGTSTYEALLDINNRHLACGLGPGHISALCALR